MIKTKSSMSYIMRCQGIGKAFMGGSDRSFGREAYGCFNSVIKENTASICLGEKQVFAEWLSAKYRMITERLHASWLQ